MYSKKKFIVIAVIVLTVVLGILVMQKIYQNKLDEKDMKIEKLQVEVDSIGDMTTAFRVVSDVKAGNKCNDYELEAVEMPIDLSGNTVYDTVDIIGRYYKLNLAVGTILTNDMFIDYELTDDMRLMDVVFDEIPIGLEKGDYIDVRISFPLGQDYIAMSHKCVAEINGSTVKLVVGQRDFYCYESMKTDIATFKSTKIYGAEYLEAGLQLAATTYYPIILDVLLTMIKDPNINTGDYSSILVLREQLEEQLLNSEKVDIAQTVTSGRLSISTEFDTAKDEYEKIQMQKEKEEAKVRIKAEQDALKLENKKETLIN